MANVMRGEDKRDSQTGDRVYKDDRQGTRCAKRRSQIIGALGPAQAYVCCHAEQLPSIGDGFQARIRS